MLNPLTLYLLLVIFLATLIRSAFGFGEALIAVPLLALRIPVSVAAPLAVLLSITIAAVIVVQDRRHVHFRSATWLVIATIPGIPLGLWLLKAANERVVDSILAAVLISFSAYSLMVRTPPRLEGEGRGPMLAFGFAAGVLGGAYGMNGGGRDGARNFYFSVANLPVPRSRQGIGAHVRWRGGGEGDPDADEVSQRRGRKTDCGDSLDPPALQADGGRWRDRRGILRATP